MSVYSEKDNLTLLDGEANSEGRFTAVSRINGKPDLVDAPVELTGGAGGRVTVSRQGVVTLDDSIHRIPPPHETVLAGTFTFVLSDGTDESPAHTARVDVTGAPACPAAFSPDQWKLLGSEAPGCLTLAVSGLPDDRGAPITDLEYRVNRGKWTSLGTGIARDYTISGLPGDQPHAVEIRAANTVGKGPRSDAKAATGATTLHASNVPDLLDAIATAASRPALDWKIICEDFTATKPIVIENVAMKGSIYDANQVVIDAAKTEQSIYKNYDINAQPVMSGGSITIGSATPYATQFNGLVQVNSSGPIKFEQIGMHRKAKGVPGKDRRNKVTHSLEIDHTTGRFEPVVWVHDCKLGSYKTAGENVRDYSTQIENNDSALVIISDCEFDGVYNAMVTRRSKKTLTLRNRISHRRINDVWSNIQDKDNTNLVNFTAKQLQSVGNICLPAKYYPQWANAHSDYFQIGAATDTRDYELLVYANRVVNEQGLLASGTFPTGRITTRGWILGNFIATENSHAITPGSVMAGNRLVVAHNTCVKYAMSARQSDLSYGGSKAEAQIRVNRNTRGSYTVRSNILGRLVGPGGTLATSDRTVPNPPARWGKSGAAIFAQGNAYVSNFGKKVSYSAAFQGPFRRSGDAGKPRAVWDWQDTDYARFVADIDRIFRPLPGGPARAKGHLATGASF